MKIKLSLLAVLSVLSLFVFALPASSEPVVAPTAQGPRMLRSTTTESLGSAAEGKIAVLADWTAGVLVSWPGGALPEVSRIAVAGDIAEAVYARGGPDPWAEAALLGSLAFWESRFASYVASGDCNDPAWRAVNQDLVRAGGSCDNGRAYTIFQIWPARDPSSPLYELCSTEALKDDVKAAKCALAIAARDPSLCGYTGEDASLGCTKAEHRVRWALEAVGKHPHPKTL